MCRGWEHASGFEGDWRWLSPAEALQNVVEHCFLNCLVVSNIDLLSQFDFELVIDLLGKPLVHNCEILSLFNYDSLIRKLILNCPDLRFQS